MLRATPITSLQQGQILISTHCLQFPMQGARIGSTWLPPPIPVNVTEANVSASLEQCQCGAQAVVLRALKYIGTGDTLRIRVGQRMHAGSITALAQFDGSCRDPEGDAPSCGAGVVIWLLTENGAELVDQAGIMLPEAKDSAEAEAHAGAHAVLLLRKALAVYPVDNVEIQGDNSALIQFWTGEATYRSTRMQNILSEAREVIKFQLPQV